MAANTYKTSISHHPSWTWNFVVFVIAISVTLLPLFWIFFSNYKYHEAERRSGQEFLQKTRELKVQVENEEVIEEKDLYDNSSIYYKYDIIFENPSNAEVISTTLYSGVVSKGDDSMNFSARQDQITLSPGVQKIRRETLLDIYSFDNLDSLENLLVRIWLSDQKSLEDRKYDTPSVVDWEDAKSKVIEINEKMKNKRGF